MRVKIELAAEYLNISSFYFVDYTLSFLLSRKIVNFLWSNVFRYVSTLIIFLTIFLYIKLLE